MDSLPGTETAELASWVVRSNWSPPLIDRESHSIAVIDKQATAILAFITRFRHQVHLQHAVTAWRGPQTDDVTKRNG